MIMMLSGDEEAVESLMGVVTDQFDFVGVNKMKKGRAPK